MINECIQKLFNSMNKQIFLRGSQLEIQKNIISVKKPNKIFHKLKKQNKNSLIQQFTLFQSNESKPKKLNQLLFSPPSRVRSNLLSKSCQEHKLHQQMVNQHKKRQKTLFVKQKIDQSKKNENLSYLPVFQVKINSSISQITQKNPNMYNFYSKKNPNLNKCMIICNKKKVQYIRKKKTISGLDYSLIESESNGTLQQKKDSLVNPANKDHSECKINFFNKQNTRKRYFKQKLSLDFQLIKNSQQNSMLKKSSTTPISYLASDELISHQYNINKPKHLQTIQTITEIMKGIILFQQNSKQENWSMNSANNYIRRYLKKNHNLYQQMTTRQTIQSIYLKIK